MNATEIYLNKRLKINLQNIIAPAVVSQNYALVLTLQRNIETLGFSFSKELASQLVGFNSAFIAKLYNDIIPILKKLKGSNVKYKPMYPNFPQEVMDASEAKLWWTAIVHYWSDGTINLADKEADKRKPLTENVTLTVIDTGSTDDFNSILTDLVASNSSLSEYDKEVVTWMLSNVKNSTKLLPAKIPQRETMCLVATHLLKQDDNVDLYKLGVAKTATDALRIATNLSGGDISLAEPTKYKKLGRPIRRALLNVLEKSGSSLEEDMLRHASKWIRLGEIIHPGQYKTQYPKAYKAFDKLRNNKHIATVASRTEQLIKEDGIKTAELLKQRPGDFLRRLDHLLRTHKSQYKEIIDAFVSVADKCATPALLNVYNHFSHRFEGSSTRCIFPKGGKAKMKIIEGLSQPLPLKVIKAVTDNIELVLLKRFSKLGPLGKVYLDSNLKYYPIAFAQRSASKALRTLPRGSYAPLDGENDRTDGKLNDTMRFFIWWKNGNGRTDLDLSAEFLNEDFASIGTISYYNLRELGGTHSGDIVDAPNGACEFIDISIDKLKKRGARYVAMIVYSFTTQPFKDLPECFAGWMTRNEYQSGKVFDARTVKGRADLTGDQQCSVPILIDLELRRVIWADIGLKTRPCFPNNVENNKANIGLSCRNIAKLNKPTLHFLLKLHAQARGTLVENKNDADVVFDESLGYEIDTIASKYLQ